MFKPRIASSLVMVILQFVAAVSANAADKIIYLQPLQPAPAAAAVQGVVVALRAFYPVEVRILPTASMPPTAWYAPRKRWRADRLLTWLESKLPAVGAKVMGLTTADISTTKAGVNDWGVLGLGTLDGTSCVISTFRTLRGVSAAMARERLAKVAVHEVGHTFDLDHCPTAKYLMEDARAKVATVDGEVDLCPVCRQKLTSEGVEVPANVKSCWRASRL